MKLKKFVVAVIVEEKLLRVESDGTEKGTYFTGTPDHIELFREAVHLGLLVEIEMLDGVKLIQAGYENPWAVIAALYSISPDKTTLWEVPTEISRILLGHDDLSLHRIPEGMEPVCGKPLQT